MARYELTKDWIAKNIDRIKEAYISAKAQKYDISSEEDMDLQDE